MSVLGSMMAASAAAQKEEETRKLKQECAKLRAERDEALEKLHWYFVQFTKRGFVGLERQHLYANYCDCVVCSAERLLRKHGLLEESYD